MIRSPVRRKVQDAGLEGLGAHELQGVRGRVLEESLPVADCDRVEHQVELVEQPVRQQPPDQRGAAGHPDVAVGPFLDLSELRGDVAGHHRGVVPLRLVERARHHVLRDVVDERSEGTSSPRSGQ
jgi:hypothetical protein